MYNQTVLNLFHNPQTLGPLPEADVSGQAGAPGEGPYMTVRLRLEGEQIAEARFETYGCPSAIACGSLLTRWLVGKTHAQAHLMEANDLLLLLGGLPLGKEHCAQLAVTALRQALAQWAERRSGPSE